MTEWQTVPSVPHLQVNEYGFVRSAPFVGGMPNGSERSYGGGSGTPGQWDGVRYIVRDFRSGRTYKVGRLVCETFNGPIPFGNAVCMHLNEKAFDNRPKNLKWGTQKENLNAPGFIEYCKGRTGENSPTAKAKRKRA